MSVKDALATAARWTLALLAAFWVLLWGVSLWYCHNAYVGDDRGTSGIGLNVRLTPGSLEVTGIRFVSEPGRAAHGINAYYDVRSWADNPRLIRHPDWVRGGFGLHRWHETYTKYGPKYTNFYFGMALPFWLLAILCGIWPALYWHPRRIRRQRITAGLCPDCGYDLRGTPNRCPECGTRTEAAAQPADAADRAGG